MQIATTALTLFLVLDPFGNMGPIRAILIAVQMFVDGISPLLTIHP